MSSFGGGTARPCQRCGAPLPPGDFRCVNCGFAHMPPSGPDQRPTSSAGWGPPSQVQGAPNWNPGPGPQGPGGPPSYQPFPGGPGFAAPPASGTSFGSQAQLPHQGFAPPHQAPYPGPNYPPAPDGASFSGTAYPFVPPPQHRTGNLGGQAIGNSWSVGPGPVGPQMGNANPGFGSSAQFAHSVNAQPDAAMPFPNAGIQGRSLYAEAQKSRSKRGILLISLLVILLLVAGGGVAYYFLAPSLFSPTVTPASTGGNTAPTGPVLFSDSFKDTSKGWDLQSEQGIYTVAITNGTLTLEDDHHRSFPEYVPGTSDKPLQDLTVTVDAMLSKGDPDNGYGVYLRSATGQDGNPSTYYCIEFYGDGTFAVFKGTTDANGATKSAKVVDYSKNPALEKQGKINHLSITAKGTNFTIRANGKTIKTFTDSSYKSGAVALFVSNLSGLPAGAQAQFSNLMIYGA